MGRRSRSTNARTPQKKVESGPAPASCAGWPITPRDLAAQRPLYEKCASLSPGAALLAVLVAWIGEHERIQIHPVDLQNDLRQRLHWRDRPGSITPELIGTWLRRLGFSRAGRDRRGVKYEIRWEQLWALDPREVSSRWQHLDVFTLDGAELLWLLAEEPRLFFSPKLWCPSCERVVATTLGEAGDESWPCPECHAPTRALDPSWLERASGRMRDAIQNDRDLLGRIKAKWEDLHDGAPLPPLPGPLTWLHTAWERAGKPRGRPTAILNRYELAHVVGRLESAHVPKPSMEKIFEARGEERLKVYRELPDRVQRFLGPEFDAQLSEVPRVDRHTLWASVEWARRQWVNPSVRVHSEPLFSPQRYRPNDEGESPGSRSAESAPALHPERAPELCSKCGAGPLDRRMCERNHCPWKS